MSLSDKDKELDAVITRFHRGEVVADISSRRQFYDAVAQDLPLPLEARFESCAIAGLPAERTIMPGARSDTAVLFFHGGGYTVGSPRGYRALTAALSSAASAPCISVDYRLAPEYPFPAAVLDTTAVYRDLLDQGLRPCNIAFAGDSAGGGLVLATMLCARDAGLPMPSAGYGLSPWLDLAGEGISFTQLAAVDRLMTAEAALGCAAAYLQGQNPKHPWASPVHADLTGLPPLLLQVGSTEMFLDDSIRLARNAALAGVHVELQIWPGMPHVWQRFAPVLKEGLQAARSGGAFIKARFDKS